MKLRITFKDPDGVYESIGEALRESIERLVSLGLSNRAIEAAESKERESANAALKRWIEHGEYLTVEFDTDAGTATVIETGAR